MVDLAAAAADFDPLTGEETAALQVVKTGIDSALLKIEHTPTSYPQLFNKRVSMCRPSRHSGQKHQFEIPFETLPVHASIL